MVGVEEAIRKGRQTLVYIPAAIVLVLMGIGLYLIIAHYFDTVEWVIFFFIIGGFLTAWLYWSFMVTRWRIWAFGNVRNVHELKRKAIRSRIMGKDGGFFEKTEIRNSEQKQQLKRIELKFREKDIFHEDASVPQETRIGHSKAMLIFGFSLPFLFIGVGVYVWFRDGEYGMLLLSIPLSVFIFYKNYQKLQTPGPILVLNASGITMNGFSPISWKNIEFAFVIFRQEGKHVRHFLAVTHDTGYNELPIFDWNISLNQLEKLLEVYRFRFEKNNIGFH